MRNCFDEGLLTTTSTTSTVVNPLSRNLKNASDETTDDYDDEEGSDDESNDNLMHFNSSSKFKATSVIFNLLSIFISAVIFISFY